MKIGPPVHSRFYNIWDCVIKKRGKVFSFNPCLVKSRQGPRLTASGFGNLTSKIPQSSAPFPLPGSTSTIQTRMRVSLILVTVVRLFPRWAFNRVEGIPNISFLSQASPTFSSLIKCFFSHHLNALLFHFYLPKNFFCNRNGRFRPLSIFKLYFILVLILCRHNEHLHSLPSLSLVSRTSWIANTFCLKITRMVLDGIALITSAFVKMRIIHWRLHIHEH